MRGCTALVVLLAMSSASAEIIDRILAVTNGSVITLSDVHAATQFGIVPATPGDRAAAVNRLIDRRLMLTEVDRYGSPEPKREQIDAGVAAIRARFASPAAFDAALAATGTTLEQLRRYRRDDLRIEAYLQQRFGFATQPSEEEILAYYRAHEAELSRGGVLRSYDDARNDARAALVAERRAATIAEWIAALRRRADIVILP